MGDNDETRPIYCRIRNFLGEKDLVVSLYTQKCQFRCTFCALRQCSSDRPIPIESQKRQIDYVFKKFNRELGEIERISIGNEGSIFDRSRVPFELLEYLSERCREMVKLRTLSFETRPEYIKSEILKKLKMLFRKRIDCTTGFETKDKRIRRKLNKYFSEKIIETATEALSEINGTLTTHIILKPDLSMTEKAAVKEALSSINYLVGLTRLKEVPLTIYLNPLYIPTGSPLCKEAKEKGYLPPLTCSLVKVLDKAIDAHPELRIYAGLYSENHAEKSGEFFCPRKKDLEILDMLKKFNKTQEPKAISDTVCQRCDWYSRI